MPWQGQGGARGGFEAWLCCVPPLSWVGGPLRPCGDPWAVTSHILMTAARNVRSWQSHCLNGAGSRQNQSGATLIPRPYAECVVQRGVLIGHSSPYHNVVQRDEGRAPSEHGPGSVSGTQLRKKQAWLPTEQGTSVARLERSMSPSAPSPWLNAVHDRFQNLLTTELHVGRRACQYLPTADPLVAGCAFALDAVTPPCPKAARPRWMTHPKPPALGNPGQIFCWNRTCPGQLQGGRDFCF